MSRHGKRQPLLFVKIWVILCATLVTSGWLLSAFGMLNATGYLGILSLSALGWGGYLRTRWPSQRFSWGALRRRLRHPLPALFLFIAALILLSGLLHLPNNYDTLTYRLPRVFHWLFQERWHWITTTLDARLNVMLTGQEWLFAPVMVLTHSVRPLFLFNFIPFLLFPGLYFGTLRQLGVAQKVAWYWMWLLPTVGYCFFLQAGSLGSDCFPIPFLLASLYFPLRARQSHALSDLWFGALAAALLAGSKITNAPLLLCFAIAAWPSRHLLLQRKLATTAVAVVCIGISFIPMALINQHHIKDWSGSAAFSGTSSHKITNPLIGLAGNSLQLLVQNTIPPIFPAAEAWNRKADHLCLTILKPIKDHFPRFSLRIPQMQAEESAGLGGPACLLLSIALGTTILFRPPSPKIAPISLAITAAGWIALLIVLARVGSAGSPRLIAPYYPICAALILLLPINAMLIRKAPWRKLAFVCALLSIPIIILQPARPLWPAQSTIQRLRTAYPENHLIARFDRVFTVYRERSTVFNAIQAAIPPEIKHIGVVTIGDVNITSLFYPFGKRLVHDLSADTEAETLLALPHPDPFAHR